MIGVKHSATDPARVLVVADGDAEAGAIVACFGEAMPEGAIRTDPSRLLADAAQMKPDVVVLGTTSLDVAVRQALALRAVKTADAAATFMLLLCASAETATAARLCREGVCDDYVQHFPVPADPERLAASLRTACRVALADRPRAAARARPIVLVVEDDTFSHQLIAITLETRGVDLVFEADGAMALERIVTVQPDLVLMDVMLPAATAST